MNLLNTNTKLVGKTQAFVGGGGRINVYHVHIYIDFVFSISFTTFIHSRRSNILLRFGL